MKFYSLFFKILIFCFFNSAFCDTILLNNGNPLFIDVTSTPPEGINKGSFYTVPTVDGNDPLPRYIRAWIDEPLPNGVIATLVAQEPGSGTPIFQQLSTTPTIMVGGINPQLISTQTEYDLDYTLYFTEIVPPQTFTISFNIEISTQGP